MAMISNKLKEHEQLLAAKFLSLQVYDSFSCLGWFNYDGQWVFRAYLDQYQDWSIRVNGVNLTCQLIVADSGFFSWCFPGLANRPRKYEIYCLQNHDEIHLIDPYCFEKQLSAETQYLWNSGKLTKAWRDIGANQTRIDGIKGFIFRVWAPNAKRVAVIGDFNNWNPLANGMRPIVEAGIWEIFLPQLNAEKYTCYKFHIITQDDKVLYKADPYATQMEHPPKTASVLRNNKKFIWQDQDWIINRSVNQSIDKAISIYEVHLASWRRADDRPLSYLELKEQLVPYVKEMGYSHVEFLPISEYPLDASWGYQPVGLYAPTIRLGTDEELKSLIEAFHKAGIGVILDWVAGHFPSDEYGLSQFDGSFLYEYQDLRKGYHPDWKTLVFNYSRLEVINYLISNANYWLEEFHIDGLRFDAVSSMLYLSYSRKTGEWEPNIYGGSENLEAVNFIKQINQELHKNYPGILTFAEEATMWAGITKSIDAGGLGFDYKWNMGFMHDSLLYIEQEPGDKPKEHHVLTHCIDYAFSEHYLLPLSHDEVVHGKSPLIGKMPGFDEHKFPLLMAYYAYMWAHPGKKLLFMGAEFAQRSEWDFADQLEWQLLQYKEHITVQNCIQKLNYIYRTNQALHQSDLFIDGFKWLKKDSTQESVFAFLRSAPNGSNLICVSNFSDKSYQLRLGVPKPGNYQLIFNSSAEKPTTATSYLASNISWDGQFHSIEFEMPSLSSFYFTWQY